MEIVFGEGGDDSKNFVDELLSAYLKYCQSKKLKTDLIFSDYGHKVIKVKGEKAGFHFRNESGKHVCQRIPSTESKGRKHTSTISVAILPIRTKSNVVLNNKDLKIEAVNLGGPGGQHGNRSMSGCRMTHIPSGIKVCINGRSYHSNEAQARIVMAARIEELEERRSKSKYEALRGSQIQGGSRSGKVRTYNFLQSRVTDHILGSKTGNIKAVMKGQFDLLF